VRLRCHSARVRRLIPSLGVLVAGAVLVPAAACAATPARRQAAGPALQLTAGSAVPGWVRLAVRGRPGATVALREQVRRGSRLVGRLTLAAPAAEVRRAARWECGRRERRFTATIRGPNGVQRAVAAVRTPSCRSRLRMAVIPSRVGAGRATTVRLADLWRLGGITGTVCATPRGGAPRCQAVRLGSRRIRATSRLRLPFAGRWTIRLRTVHGQSVSRTVVAQGRRPLRVLATGDSMIYIIDEKLAAALRRSDARVPTDPHPATGLSKPALLDWPAHARASAKAVRADVAVVFLGANDGFPLRSRQGKAVPCCGAPWVAEYSSRARAVMRAHLRGGSALVYWVLLPAPRSPLLVPTFAAINAALRDAASAFADGVRLIDVGRVIAPGGLFQEQITYNGRAGVVVRQPDGVHLSGAGAAITTSMILDALRRDGLLPR
jgi:lysophospholipase L1-like esterase